MYMDVKTHLSQDVFLKCVYRFYTKITVAFLINIGVLNLMFISKYKKIYSC